MEPGCVILGCLLLIQMTAILVLLNPIYDVRRVTRYMNNIVKHHKHYYIVAVAAYFGFIVYIGMYTPLRNIYHLLTSNILNEFEKVIVLSKVEKNYLIAGFSLFLFIVLYGLRELVTYSATLLELSVSTAETDVLKNSIRMQTKGLFLSENILPSLLRVKRSVSYETILFANEVREQLKAILKNAEYPHNSCTISNILHNKVNTICAS